MLDKFSVCDTPLQYRLLPKAKLFHSKHSGERDGGERAKQRSILLYAAISIKRKHL